MQSNTQTSKHGLKVQKWTENYHNARVASASRIASDLCAIPVISLAAVPQQQRDREIIGADTLLVACPAGAQCIAADAGSDGKGRI